MNNYEEEYSEDEEDLEEDDLWDDTPEFDERIEELKTALRADIKRETKELIENLQKELDELKDYKENKLKIERKYHEEIAKMAKAEADIERKYRDMRLCKLLDEFCVAGWQVAMRYEQLKEKCDKCNENGVITFYSPQDSNKGKADRYYPCFWWTDEDKSAFEQVYNITHSDAYTVYGFKRTGCAGCPFNSKFEEELKVLHKYEPKLATAVEHIFAPSYEYTRAYRKFKESRRKKHD